MAENPDFDAVAAALRADAQDTNTFIEVLASKLEGALPDAVSVRRGGGLFAREHPVVEISVELGDWSFRLAKTRGGGVRGERSHSVRGVSLKSEELPFDAWVDALLAGLAEHARSSATAAEALHRWLT